MNFVVIDRCWFARQAKEAVRTFFWPLVILLSLSACATAPKPEPSVITHVICLPMKSYSREEQKKAAEELEKLPAGSMVGRFVVDYGALRAANRACEASQEPPA